MQAMQRNAAAEDVIFDCPLPHTIQHNHPTQQPVTSVPVGSADGKQRAEPTLHNKGVVLENVLSPKECSKFCEMTNNFEMRSTVELGYNPNYRNNLRCLVESRQLADVLLERTREFLPEKLTIPNNTKECRELGFEFGSDLVGEWELTRINPRFRLCKYLPQGHFSPHYDGIFQDGEERSFMTFMVYLNPKLEDSNELKERPTGFVGGATDFVEDATKLNKVKGKITEAPVKSILWSLSPEMGTTLVFAHRVLHQGGQVKDGEKFILRSDLMYKRKEPLVESKDRTLARSLLKQAQELEGSGNAAKAVPLYRKAFKLFPELEELA